MPVAAEDSRSKTARLGYTCHSVPIPLNGRTTLSFSQHLSKSMLEAPILPLYSLDMTLSRLWIVITYIPLSLDVSPVGRALLDTGLLSFVTRPTRMTIDFQTSSLV